MIEIVKKAEQSDDLIIRMYECYNRRTNDTVTCAINMETVEEYDFLENSMGSMDVIESDFSFQIKPYEIKTFELKR
jgi:alpha-mannosidase